MNLKLLINRFTLLKWDFTYLSFTDIDFSERIINSSN